MATIREILFDVAPEFETTDETALARVDRFIDRAAEEINRDVWGTKADEATAYLAAHKLAMRSRAAIGGSAGAVTRRKNGDFEEQYASTTAAGAGEYGSTVYGSEFARLLGGLGVTPILL